MSHARLSKKDPSLLTHIHLPVEFAPSHVLIRFHNNFNNLMQHNKSIIYYIKMKHVQVPLCLFHNFLLPLTH